MILSNGINDMTLFNNYSHHYLQALARCGSHTDIPGLYEWFWQSRDVQHTIIDHINHSLELESPCLLQYDLPTISVGNTSMHVVVMANPGWHHVYNRLEDRHKRVSLSSYYGFVRDFFRMYPLVTNNRNTTWTSALGFLGQLYDCDLSDLCLADGRTRWEIAHDVDKVGGWDLFPFHSSRDGISCLNNPPEWMQSWLMSSLDCLFKHQPRSVIIASKSGAMIMLDKLRNVQCDIKTVSIPNHFSVFYAKYNSTDVIIIPRQIFSNGRHPGYRVVIDAIRNAYFID